MGRKHGFRGTPVRPPKNPSSVGGIFERRGDPMVSQREGQEKYGRNLDTENPDFDRYFAEDRARERAANNILRASQIDKGRAFRKANVQKADAQTRATNLILRAKKRQQAHRVEVKPHSGKPHRVKGSFYYFPDQKEKLPDNPEHEPQPFPPGAPKK